MKLCMLQLLLLLSFAGCAAPKAGERVKVPENSKLLAYGKGMPATYLPDEPGTIYFVEDESGRVVYAISTVHQHPPVSTEMLPNTVRANFQTDKSYRVYFAPEGAATTSAR